MFPTGDLVPDYLDDKIERALTENVEGPAHACLSRIRARGPISDDDRTCLATYIGTLIMRGPRKRRKALELLPNVVDDLARQIRAQIDEWAEHSDPDPHLVARRRIEVDVFEENAVEDPSASVIEPVRSPAQ